MKIFAEGLILYGYIVIFHHMLLAKFTLVNGDWLVDCGDCRCKWNSGKKTADCKNISVSTVPENLSSELQVLDLSHNRITFLEENAFLTARLQNLHKLFMRNCSLENLDPYALRSLEILIELDLSNNLLRTLQANLFASLVKVRSLILNSNLLESLDDGVFQNLKYLHKVELKENRISHVSTEVFVNVPLLSQIYLSGNHLSFLRKEPFESLKRLTSLSLEMNPWNCTCELQVFRDFALKRNLYTPPTSCYYPSHLRGMLWIEDQPEAFACKPKIIYPSRGASINTSKENVTLICRVHASPNTLIAWDYNKQMYNNGQHHQARVNIQLLREEQSQEKEFGRDIFISRLTILGAEKSDEGIYTCLAENAGGKDAVQMSLLVQKPSQKDLFLQSNLIIVICLMALGLLSASVFLAMVTCCIYKRFKAINQHHHHHLGTTSSGGGVVGGGGGSGGLMDSNGSIGDVGTDNGTSQNHHHLLQKTNLNGFNSSGGTLVVGGYHSGVNDKYTEAIKHTTLGNGGGGALHLLHQRHNHQHHHLLRDTLNETQLGQSEKTYLEKNIEDSLHNPQHTTTVPHGQHQNEINVITPTKRHHKKGEGSYIAAEYQPDLLPFQKEASISFNNSSNDSIAGTGQLYSPCASVINQQKQQQQQQKQQETSYDSRQLMDHHYLQSHSMTKWQHDYHHHQQPSYLKQTTSTRHLQEDQHGQSIAQSNALKSKYTIDQSTAECLQSSSRTTTELRELSNTIQLPKLPKHESGFITQQNHQHQSHTALHSMRPTENTSYEYRQPPPPPYCPSTGTVASAAMSTLRRTRSVVNNGDHKIKDDDDDSTDVCYRADNTTGDSVNAVAAAAAVTRQTIVTTSPSLNFLTGYTPRRQLL